ncbi:YrhB domain-containing protein [Saccharopolyspora spinosa]|uniref:Papain fold toxin 1 (Glutamine deamidase) of polymorphic toxin system n=2 Tax=Saccharopolyspora spinosa TaxID=60894 RepID=A0A2N3Y555_SACSN|nr:YrhB domain-containing protein [Saccharopolyspora spinosa]PKW18045.1 papain fold toxin 1 (glutamine deamidase) of polymorphic toxin system [Saccharopolyspora spinosa]
MNELAERARSWLQDTYGPRVVLRGEEAILSTERAAFFGCGYVESDEPMLAATICVPRDGAEPFPASNAGPLDESLNVLGSAPGSWRWRVNAGNCVVATDAAVSGWPASALPWDPAGEVPGWWDRMLASYFPDAEVVTCATWEDARRTIVDGGVGTRAVVWLRRQLGGRELAGHLLYADYADGAVVFLDGLRGTVAEQNEAEVAELVVARFRRRRGDSVGGLLPWEVAAEDFAGAVEKAEAWLAYRYDGEVGLVGADPADETERGWLFACTTRSFRDSGDWREQMLDAALVVPKAPGEQPFGLPNRDPWTWLDDWDAGKPGLMPPPEPGQAAWFGPMVAELGPVVGVGVHEHWFGVLEEIASFPVQTQVLVWLRRRDVRGRESVGHLLVAVNDADGVRLFDPMDGRAQPLIETAPFELRVLRFGL